MRWFTACVNSWLDRMRFMQSCGKKNFYTQLVFRNKKHAVARPRLKTGIATLIQQTPRNARTPSHASAFKFATEPSYLETLRDFQRRRALICACANGTRLKSPSILAAAKFAD